MSNAGGSPWLDVSCLGKTYSNNGVPTVKDVSFQASLGETIALLGPSGCGKTTLLNLLGLLDRPSEGQIRFDGQPSEQIRLKYAFRSRHIAFVFQFHHLVPTMTLSENVQAPLLPAGYTTAQRKDMAEEVLAHVGLSHLANWLPAQVSGGERQRAALARALVNRPKLILADEPTGNLDSANGTRVMDLLLQHARQHRALVLVATHNSTLANIMERKFHMLDGRLTECFPSSSLTNQPGC